MQRASTRDKVGFPLSYRTTREMAGIDPNTLLLCNFDSAIEDQTGKRVLTPQGGAAISTAAPKYGAGCLSLDGTDDYVTAPQSEDFNFYSLPFTLESWVKWGGSLVNDVNMLMQQWGSAPADWQWITYYIASTGKMVFYAQDTVVKANYSCDYTPTGAWEHWAWCFDGGTLRFFQNGTSLVLTESTAMGVMPITTAGGLFIGANRSGGQECTCDLDDLRICNKAWYTTNFTPDGPHSKYL